jgi:hypothetical protein
VVVPPPASDTLKQRSDAAASAPASAAARPLEAPKPLKPVATGPEATCSALNPLSHFVCMERECLRSQFNAQPEHPDCQKWHRAARRETQ